MPPLGSPYESGVFIVILIIYINIWYTQQHNFDQKNCLIPAPLNKITHLYKPKLIQTSDVHMVYRLEFSVSVLMQSRFGDEAQCCGTHVEGFDIYIIQPALMRETTTIRRPCQDASIRAVIPLLSLWFRFAPAHTQPSSIFVVQQSHENGKYVVLLQHRIKIRASTGC